MKAIARSLPLLLVVLSAALAWQVQRASVKLPEPYATPSVTNRPQVVEKPAGAELHVPPGFEVKLYASGFQRPRIMIYGPSGEILITDTVKNGSVSILKPGDGASRKIIEGLDRPYGMAWWKDYLYVAEPTSVKRYKYDAKTMTPGKGEEIISMPASFGQGHNTRTITFDAKGEKLYLGVGSASNVNAGEPEMRAAISECTPEGKNCVIYASGTRNPTTIRFNPVSKVLWASVQERDEIGDDLVPDFFTSIKRGGFYGWPYSYIGPNEDPRRKGERSDLVQKTIVPDVILGAHVAVIDWIFYGGKQFPAKYHGGAFLALHGSWNRSRRVGQSVVFVPFKDGKPAAAQPEEFLTGWMISPDSREVWGRPTGVFEMKDGSLLISEDGNNKVWHVTYKR